MSAYVDLDLPHLRASWGTFRLQSGHPLARGCPAVMESVDCWPLVIIPIQTLGGKTSFSNHPSGCDFSLVSLSFTVYGTASNPASLACVYLPVTDHK